MVILHEGLYLPKLPVMKLQLIAHVDSVLLKCAEVGHGVLYTDTTLIQ